MTKAEGRPDRGLENYERHRLGRSSEAFSQDGSLNCKTAQVHGERGKFKADARR